MKSNLKEIIEAIPDFEDFMKLADEIANLSYNKMQLENGIKAKEAETFRTAMSQPLENGKLPSASFVTNAYVHTGFNGELLAEREKLAYVQSALENKKIQLSIYRDMINLFQTVSANERSSGF
jgi:hypothetical protein